MSNDKNRERISKYIFFGVLAVYCVALFYLYYNQLFYGETGRFESDTYVHVKFAVEDGYYHSLTAFIYLLLYSLPFSEALTSVVLTATTVGSIFATVRLIKVISKIIDVTIPNKMVYIMSVFGNVLMAFYVSFIGSRHYIGYECANMWHNSTYTFMRCFAILTVIAYLDNYKNCLKEISFKTWIVLAGLLAVTTGFKASFLTVFAPTLAIILLIDLIKGAKFKNIFCVATTVLPAIMIMFAQSIVLSGGGEGGYIISPFTALKLRGEHPKAALILSVAYPLCILFFHFKDMIKERLSRSVLLMWGIAFLEVFLIAETGERSLDGNFMWGYSIALFFLFVFCMIISFKAFIEARDNNFGKIRFAVETLILLWHVISGVWYFALLLTGVTYFV